MSVQIIYLEEEKELINDFIHFDVKEDSSNKYFSSLYSYLNQKLLSSEHPAWKRVKIHRWVAIKDEKVVGKIAAIHSKSDFDNKNLYTDDLSLDRFKSFSKNLEDSLFDSKFRSELLQSKKIGFFGFFESIDDIEVAGLLFRKVNNYFKRYNFDFIIGPLSPNGNYESGIVVHNEENFHQHILPYNESYYEGLILENNFMKFKDNIVYKVQINDSVIENIFLKNSLKLTLNKSKALEKLNITKVNINENDDNLNIILRVFNEYSKSDQDFNALSEDEFYSFVKELNEVSSDVVFLLAKIAEQPVGYIAFIPDYSEFFKNNFRPSFFSKIKMLYNKKNISCFRLLGYIINNEKYHFEILDFLFKKAQEYINKEYYNKNLKDLTFILESNDPRIDILDSIQVSPKRIYREYIKPVNAN